MTQFEFMKKLIVADCNAHRAELGLDPVSYAQMEREGADGAPVDPDGEVE